MISLPAGVQVWLAAGVTDMRRGMYGLATLVETTRNPMRSVSPGSAFDPMTHMFDVVVIRLRDTLILPK